jgi:hypothetical protein
MKAAAQKRRMGAFTGAAAFVQQQPAGMEAGCIPWSFTK